MKRRAFIAALSSAAAWPLVARGQQTAMPVIANISVLSPATMRQPLAAFREGLKETGYIVGQNVATEHHFTEGQFERIPALVSDLVRRPVAMIVGASNVALAAKQMTSTIPIIFNAGDDPVRLGLVTSLSRPGGNLTGIVQFTQGLEAKRLGLLHELVPKASPVAVLINPNFFAAEGQARDVQEAATGLGVQTFILHANTSGEIDAAFATLAQRRTGALQVCSAPLFYVLHQKIVLLAARHAIPAIYERRDFAEAGGLMSYGTSLVDAYRQMGVYAGRILRGGNPSDLPVVQMTKFEFVVNLKAARAIGLDVPGSISARADEVIE